MRVLVGAVCVPAVVSALAWATLTTSANAVQQPAARVDFARDVQPIFRQHCYGCHGPTQQMNGFRLDRRRDAMRGGTIPAIGPGNSAGSRLYQRLIGAHFGPQMPPTGALPADQIAVVKAWIDQGAVWPDAASGEQPPLPVNPDAVRAVNLMRGGDWHAARRMLARTPSLADARALGGATPLMFAVLYGDASIVRELLAAKANAKAVSDSGATALMWAAADVDKAQALLDHGADVNAKSLDGRTALMIAAGTPGATTAVKLLLDRGADVNVVGPALYGPTTALTEAAFAGNDDVFKLLVAAGANLTAGPAALGLALRSGCMTCAEALLKAYPEPLITRTMFNAGPPTGPALGTPMLLQGGASIDATDPSGRSMLMIAAASDAMPVDAIKALLARKMNVNERNAAGETPLMLARRHGDSPVVKLLLEAGATDEGLPPAPAPTPASSVRQALTRAVPLLQRADVSFLEKSGCVSCHNNSLTPLALDAARKLGIKTDEAVESRQARKIGAYLETWRERALQGVSIPGEADTVSYILAGLAAAKYPADVATDAHALLLKRAQTADGRWRIFANRPPIESSDVQVTALSMRAMQHYAPPARKTEFDRAIARASVWLRSATVRTTEERAFQLLGMSWSSTPRKQMDAPAQALLAEQRPDGGWAQLPTMTSDAYATGQALYALVQSGTIQPTAPAFRRGVEFLLKTQLADGSWYVRTRAIPIQPLFDADFPHGRDAFISAAATNWATMALALAPKGTT